jgi:hypothetical protein
MRRAASRRLHRSVFPTASMWNSFSPSLGSDRQIFYLSVARNLLPRAPNAVDSAIHSRKEDKNRYG